MAFSFTFLFQFLLLAPSVIYASPVQDPELVIQEVQKYVIYIQYFVFDMLQSYTLLPPPWPVWYLLKCSIFKQNYAVLFYQNLRLLNRKIFYLLFWFIFLFYHINCILHYQLVCTILLQSITMKIRQKVFGDNKLLC